MKKLITSVASALCVVLAIHNNDVQAQTEKGKILIGATSELTFFNDNATWGYKGEDYSGKEKVSAFSIRPYIGYFVMDNLNVGVALSFRSSKSNETSGNGDQTENQNSEFSVGPQVTYLFPVAEKLKFYVTAGGGCALSNLGREDNDKFAGYAYGAGPGLGYFVSKNASFDFQVSYNETHYSSKVDSDFKWKIRHFPPSLAFSVYL